MEPKQTNRTMTERQNEINIKTTVNHEENHNKLTEPRHTRKQNKHRNSHEQLRSPKQQSNRTMTKRENAKSRNVAHKKTTRTTRTLTNGKHAANKKRYEQLGQPKTTLHNYGNQENKIGINRKKQWTTKMTKLNEQNDD